MIVFIRLSLNAYGLLKFVNDSYDRYNVRVNLSSQVTDWLEFSFRGSFTREDQSYGVAGGSFGSGGDGLLNVTQTWGMVVNPWTDPDHTIREGWINQMSLGGRTTKNVNDPVLTGEFVITPLKGWNITANYTYNEVNERNFNYTKEYIWSYSPSGIPQWMNLNNSGVTTSEAYNLHSVVNAFTSYEKQLGDHYFKALAGFTQELNDNYGLNQSVRYLLNMDLPSYALAYGASTTGQTMQQLASRGWMGRINYNYREKYLIEFNGRYDGSSRFLSDSRWKFYPGVSAGWVASKENFWEPLSQSFNFLKLRASYASLGDQSPLGWYPFFPSMGVTVPTSSNYYLEGQRLASVSLPGLVDPSLTWITTTTLDLGVDMAFLNNRLNATFGWYKRKMDDYTGPAEPLPAFLGTAAPTRNSTAIETKGWDLTVEWRDRIGEVSYGVRGVLSDYKGVVVKYPNPTKTLSSGWYEGQVMGEIWGYESDGLFQSAEEVAAAPSQSLFWSVWRPGDVRYNDLNGDGKITNGTNTVDDPGDRRVIGNSTPRYVFGLTLSAEYKGFDALVFFNGTGKRDVWASTSYFWGINNNFSFLSEMHLNNYWTEETPGAYFPNPYMADGQIGKNQQTSTRYLQNGAYIRLKNIQIGYTLPSLALLNKINCKKLRVYVNGENVFSIMNKYLNYSDPDYAGSAMMYPNYRVWSAGLNITF